MAGCGDEVRRPSLVDPAGEAELNALLAADLVGPDRADAATAYEAFLPINAVPGVRGGGRTGWSSWRPSLR